MKKLTNYSYDINEYGDITVYTEVDGTTYSIADIQGCSRMSDKKICELIEETLSDLGYELEE